MRRAEPGAEPKPFSRSVGMAKRVLVIGGGIAGMAFAQTLLEKARGAVEITVVTKDPFYMAGPSRPLLLTGEQKYERIIRGYEEAAARGIRFVFGTVRSIDPANRTVEVVESPTRPAATRQLTYDYLLVAPGIVLDGTGITGYAENWWRVANVYEPGRVDVRHAPPVLRVPRYPCPVEHHAGCY